MELKEFIKAVLTDIIGGVEQAKSELDNKPAYICPPMG
jgi:hypothetical protein